MNRKMILYLKAMTIFFMSITKERVIKANRLAYIVPVWNMGRISADCQQSLFSLKHNIREIFLPLTSLWGQEKEHGMYLASLETVDR